jgi:hypothetical protein
VCPERLVCACSQATRGRVSVTVPSVRLHSYADTATQWHAQSGSRLMRSRRIRRGSSNRLTYDSVLASVCGRLVPTAGALAVAPPTYPLTSWQSKGAAKESRTASFKLERESPHRTSPSGPLRRCCRQDAARLHAAHPPSTDSAQWRRAAPADPRAGPPASSLGVGDAAATVAPARGLDPA